MHKTLTDGQIAPDNPAMLAIRDSTISSSTRYDAILDRDIQPIEKSITAYLLPL